MQARITGIAFVFSLWGLSTAFAGDATNPAKPDHPISTLDLEWESVAEASGYELKLTPLAGGEPLILKTDENKVSQQVPSGTYRVQIRSKENTSGYWGPWSETQDVDVVAKMVELRSPSDKETISEPKEDRREIKFTWSDVPGVRNYQLRIWEASAEDKSIEFVTAANQKTLKLATGHTYRWTVTVEDEKSVLYHMKPEPFTFTILGRQLTTPVIDTKISRFDVNSLRWEASANAKTYRVRLETRFLDENTWREVRACQDFRETKLEFPKLLPGHYRLEVVAEAPHRVSSEPARFEFTLKPSEAELAAKLAAIRSE